MANLEELFKRAGVELPGLERRRTKAQEVLELAGVQGVAWRPLSGAQVLQMYPPTKGRETSREGDYLVVRSGTSVCRYYDPNHNLGSNQWSYVGCNCSNLSDAQVWGWIKEAYENLKRDKPMPSKREPVVGDANPDEMEKYDMLRAKVIVTGIESMCQPQNAGRGISGHPAWLADLARAVGELPKGCQGKEANDSLEGALALANLRFQREVPVGPGSAHRVDFVIEFNRDRIGMELGTGKAERVELDLLKLVNLALRREIDYACLVLPQNVTRHSVMGRQEMAAAVNSLAAMCSPLLSLVRPQLKGMFVIWYDWWGKQL